MTTEERLEALEARIAELENRLNTQEKHIQKHQQGILEIMSNAAYKGTKDYLEGFIEPAANIQNIPDITPHEGPGILERMTNEEARSQEVIVGNWMEYSAAELNGEK